MRFLTKDPHLVKHKIDGRRSSQSLTKLLRVGNSELWLNGSYNLYDWILFREIPLLGVSNLDLIIQIARPPQVDFVPAILI